MYKYYLYIKFIINIVNLFILYINRSIIDKYYYLWICFLSISIIEFINIKYYYNILYNTILYLLYGWLCIIYILLYNNNYINYIINNYKLLYYLNIIKIILFLITINIHIYKSIIYYKNNKYNKILLKLNNEIMNEYFNDNSPNLSLIHNKYKLCINNNQNDYIIIDINNNNNDINNIIDVNNNNNSYFIL